MSWTQELLMGFQQVAVGALANANRLLSPAPDRKDPVKYDRDVLHIIEQYPGCNDARVLAFLRVRVHWFGRGTLIHNLFCPSLSTVHAAGRRLKAAGRIKSKVDHSEHHQLHRFFPNTPIWADTECQEPRSPLKVRPGDIGRGALAVPAP